jgi:hypothetical protein
MKHKKEQCQANKHKMSITRALEDKKKVSMTKNEAWVSFLYTFFIPNLNNAFASLGDDDYLGTLNPKLSKIKCKFFEKTCPIFQNKK